MEDKELGSSYKIAKIAHLLNNATLFAFDGYSVISYTKYGLLKYLKLFVI